LYKTDSFKEIYGDWEAASRIEFGTVAPDNIVKQWKANIEIALGDNSVQGTNKIHISNIPYVYSLVGIKDKPLKTKKQVLLKAMGQDPTAPNIHYVTRQMLDNLIEQIYDPVAIFKSLSTSSSPARYVAIIDEVDAKGDRVVVIISPDTYGKGYTLIPALYGKENFDRFFENTANEGKILYVKDRSAQARGRLPLPPLYTQALHNKSIISKADIINSVSISLDPDTGEPVLDTPSAPNTPDASGLLFSLTREGELDAATEAIKEGSSRERFINDQLAYSSAMDEFAAANEVALKAGAEVRGTRLGSVLKTTASLLLAAWKCRWCWAFRAALKTQPF
jgi:hypothetical protein